VYGPFLPLLRSPELLDRVANLQGSVIHRAKFLM
jgi:hypothetical protein